MTFVTLGGEGLRIGPLDQWRSLRSCFWGGIRNDLTLPHKLQGCNAGHSWDTGTGKVGTEELGCRDGCSNGCEARL